MFNLILEKLKSISKETWLVIGLMLIAALAHAWNMFHFPYFENDEATYVSQAWSFVNEGKLAPYTYYYDHAPAGWIFMGLWLVYSGGLTTFGHNPLISGRIFIFILHMVSVLLLYVITKRVTRQKLAATLAVITFSLSPLELYFGRRVLLDNIMVFWILLSLFFATRTPQRLGDAVLSAFAFAIATLSKENALFLGPVILYIIWIYSHARTRILTISLWVVLTCSILALYPLYAILKGEFFPSGTFLGGSKEHVSLILTTILQSGRGRSAFPWEQGSDFYTNVSEWVMRDPFIIIAGAISLCASMVLNERYREIKAITLTAIAEILFLARGKLVIDYYILAIIPLLAISIGIMAARPVVWAKNHISPNGYSIMICSLVVLIFLISGTPAFSRDETTNQLRAVAWVEENVPKNAYIAIDNYAYPILHDVDGYTNADYGFKIQYDPAILKGKYDEDQSRMQYFLVTHEVIIQMHAGNLPFIKKAFNNSQLIADFTKNSTSYTDISKLISTNGDWAQVYAAIPKNAGILIQSWESYKKNFIKDSGQVVDPPNGNTTSETQAYGMARAVALNDKVEFDRIWNWTRENMQKRSGDKLIARKIQIDSQGVNNLADINPSSGADEDIAMSLCKAYAKWGDAGYLNNAKEIIDDIWDHEVVNRNGRLYLVYITDNSFENQLLVNPSYLAPDEYKVFASIDSAHNWQKLADDSYTLLKEIQDQSKAGLFSNWVAINENGGVVPASDLEVASANIFGYEAFKIGYRMANDVQDSRAQEILTRLNSFYDSVWKKYHFIAAEYDLEGRPLASKNDVPTSAGAIISLHAMNQGLAFDIYKSEVVKRFYADGMYWGQPTNYLSQNWGAFAVQFLGIGGSEVFY